MGSDVISRKESVSSSDVTFNDNNVVLLFSRPLIGACLFLACSCKEMAIQRPDVAYTIIKFNEVTPVRYVKISNWH